EDVLRAQRDEVHAVLLPSLPRPLLAAAADALGMAQGGELVHTGTRQLAICADLALYGLPEGRELLAAYVSRRLGVDPVLREAMPAATHQLFQAGTADPHGAILCTPVRGEAPFFLYDPQLRHPSMVGVFVSAYVIALPGMHITTGAPLVIHPDIVEKVRGRTDLQDASLAASLARTQWTYTAPHASGSSRRPSKNGSCPCGSGRRYKSCHGKR
ncbi:MAG: hypothetical protein ACI8S6_005280, partial [Myxococcota bacterium]